MKQLRTMTKTGAAVLFEDTFEEATDKALALSEATGARKVIKRSPTSAYRWQIRDEELIPA